MNGCFAKRDHFPPPGLFQRWRGLCCLACALHETSQDDLLAFFVNKNLTAADMVKMEREDMRILMLSKSREMRTAVPAVTKSLEELHGAGKCPMHCGALRVNVIFSKGKSCIGVVRGGQILEILHDGSTLNLTKSVLGQMKENFYSVSSMKSQIGTVVDFCLHISSTKSTSALSYTSSGAIIGNMTLRRTIVNDMLTLERHLILLPRPSLIIIESITTYPDPNGDLVVPSVDPWIKLLDTVCGGIDDVAVVFSVDAKDFEQFDISSGAKFFDKLI